MMMEEQKEREKLEYVVGIEGEVLVGGPRRFVEWSGRGLWTGSLSGLIQQSRNVRDWADKGGKVKGQRRR